MPQWLEMLSVFSNDEKGYQCDMCSEAVSKSNNIK